MLYIFNIIYSFPVLLAVSRDEKTTKDRLDSESPLPELSVDSPFKGWILLSFTCRYGETSVYDPLSISVARVSAEEVV